MVNREWSARPKLYLVFIAVVALPVILVGSACGTLKVGVEEQATALEPPATSTAAPSATPAAAASDASTTAVAWYGTVHSVPGTAEGTDYVKLWHLAIWPKLGHAVGLTGADPAIDAEIDRLRDQDIKATFWGSLTCNVADYGACQLLVKRISADDGGPQVEADKVEGWSGRVGRLPAQPVSQNALLYFVLDGPVVVLYGINSDETALQAELARLADEPAVEQGGGDIRIWGELHAKVQPVTGTVINVDRLEYVSP
jgi:hypothetical protein